MSPFSLAAVRIRCLSLKLCLFNNYWSDAVFLKRSECSMRPVNLYNPTLSLQCKYVYLGVTSRETWLYVDLQSPL